MEPWLSGRHAGLDPIRRLLACSLEQCLGDLNKWVPEDPDEETSFHLRHIAGSVDRLFTYALGGSISSEQLAYMKAERRAGSRAELLAVVEQTFQRVTAQLKAMTIADFNEPRYIGRQRLETPLGVLLGHIAEHTQRHTGQVISCVKLSGAAPAGEGRSE